MTRSRGGYRGTTDPGSPPAALFRKQIREAGGMTDTPEINRLREEAWDTELCKRTGVPPYECPVPYACENSCSTETVYLVRRDAAIQAVRDTERRVREERKPAPEARWLATIDAAHRECVREIVGALREHEQMRTEPHVYSDFIERTFLSPDNPEGNA